MIVSICLKNDSCVGPYGIGRDTTLIRKLLDKKEKHKSMFPIWQFYWRTAEAIWQYYVSNMIFIGELPNDSFMFHSFAEELPKMLSWDYIWVKRFESPTFKDTSTDIIEARLLLPDPKM